MKIISKTGYAHDTRILNDDGSSPRGVSSLKMLASGDDFVWRAELKIELFSSLIDVEVGNTSVEFDDRTMTALNSLPVEYLQDLRDQIEELIIKRQEGNDE